MGDFGGWSKDAMAGRICSSARSPEARRTKVTGISDCKTGAATGTATCSRRTAAPAPSLLDHALSRC